jgi:hypothetical protein
VPQAAVHGGRQRSAAVSRRGLSAASAPVDGRPNGASQARGATARASRRSFLHRHDLRAQASLTSQTPPVSIPSRWSEIVDSSLARSRFVHLKFRFNSRQGKTRCFMAFGGDLPPTPVVHEPATHHESQQKISARKPAGQSRFDLHVSRSARP